MLQRIAETVSIRKSFLIGILILVAVIFIGQHYGTGATIFAEPKSGTTPLTVRFTVRFTENIKSPNSPCGEHRGYSVDFGDGTSEKVRDVFDSCSGPILSHDYASTGTYTAKLLGSARQTISTATIWVSRRIVSAFSASPTSGRAPLTVQFTITGRGWYTLDFGDGQVVGPTLCNEGSSCVPFTISHIYDIGTFTASFKGHEMSATSSQEILFGRHIISAY